MKHQWYRIVVISVIWLALGFMDIPAMAQNRSGDVMVTVLKEKVVALPSSGSGVEEALGMSEEVVKTGARGPTGFIQTSDRLLGFSSELRRWSAIQLSGEEHVERHLVLPRLILVQSERALYAFQEGRAHWFQEPLGPREQVKQLHGRGHVAVAITSDRAIAFSSFTGGLFSISWSPEERLLSVEDTHDSCMVRTSARQLVFRSQSTDWMEVK